MDNLEERYEKASQQFNDAEEMYDFWERNSEDGFTRAIWGLEDLSRQLAEKYGTDAKLVKDMIATIHNFDKLAQERRKYWCEKSRATEKELIKLRECEAEYFNE